VVLGIEKPAADVTHLGAALVLTVAVVSMAEIVRLGRLLTLNVPLGAVIAITPWLLDGSTTASGIHARSSAPWWSLLRCRAARSGRTTSDATGSSDEATSRHEIG
jgi:hypothetical protein